MPVFRIPRLASICVAIVALILAIPAVLVHAQSPDPASLDQISSKRYIVIDDQTGEIYAQKDAEVRGGIASLTKVFTAIVALEHGSLDMQISANESDEFDSTSTRMTGFAPGTTYTVRDLLYGMILESGNDAAHALARGVGAQPGDSDEDSVNRFVGWMNDKVMELGLKDTHFVNPHGLSDPDHYSTPRDIATFMMYAVHNGDFMAIITARDYTTTTGATITSVNRGPGVHPRLHRGQDRLRRRDWVLPDRDRPARRRSAGVGYDRWGGAGSLVSGSRGSAGLRFRGEVGANRGGSACRRRTGLRAAGATRSRHNGRSSRTPPASDVVAGVETGPRPVLVTGTPGPVAATNDDGDSPFDNWMIGLVIAAVVAGSLWMHSGMKLRYLARKSTPETEIDT